MSTFLKIVGYILAAIALIGGLPYMIRVDFHPASIVAFLIYIALSVLCFWGSSRLKKKRNNQ